MRRSFALLACLLVTGCVSTPAPRAEPWLTDSEIVTSIPLEPDGIDPQRVSFANERSIVGMVFEPLLTYDAGSLRLVPAAARELPEVSDDGRVYTFRLRAGLTYSDGAPLVAGDFAFAFRRACDPRTGSGVSFLAYPIAGCEAFNSMDQYRLPETDLLAARERLGIRVNDDRTIEFTLAKSAPQFLHATALPIGAPVRARDVPPARVGPVTFDWPEPTTYIGNGPFRLVEWKRGQRFVFERNERYRTPARLRKWTKVVIPDTTVARAAYEEGRLDAVPVTPGDDAEREALLARPDLVRTLGPCTTYLGFNTQRPPFDDPLVRMAFAKSLDREEMVRAIDRTGRAAVSLVPHAQPGHAHDDRAQAFDPAEARRLLASSTYGAPVSGQLGAAPITFPVRVNARNTARAQWAIAQWKAFLGVDVKYDPIVVGWGGQLAKGAQVLPQLYQLGWCADYPDGQDWYATIFRTGSSVTRTGFSNPAFDALIDRADRRRDPTERESLYQAASFILSRAAPVAFLSWSESWTLVSPALRGYQVSSFDPEFAQFSVAEMYRSSR